MQKDKYEGCEYNKKYDKMGISPKELFLRQNNYCWLELVFDEEDGEKTLGDLYCTDGTEYAVASNILNPTYECIQCITKFFFSREQKKVQQNKIDKLIISLLMGISKSKNRNEGVPEFYMTRDTFDRLEEHVNNTTIFSEETNPIKITASGKLLLFGTEVLYSSEMDTGVISIQPGNITLVIK